MSDAEEKTATQKTNSRAERKKRLERRADRQKKLDDSEPWNPDPGDTLTGEIFGWQKREHPKWGVWYQVFLRDDDGQIWGLPTFHGVLQSEFNRTDTAVADLVVIIYNGMTDPDPDDDSVSEYHDYTVVSESEEMEDGDIPFKDEAPVNQ